MVSALAQPAMKFVPRMLTAQRILNDGFEMD
jgi:hypothetical protein